MMIASYIHDPAPRRAGVHAARSRTARTSRAILFAAFVLSSPLLTGCGFLSGSDVQLFYPPTGPPAETIASGFDPGSPDIVILPFEDARADTARVGEIEDPSTGRFTRLAADGSVGEWMVDAIRYELTRAGYRVARATSAPDRPGVTIISGDVDMVQNSGAFKQGAEVSFVVRVARHGETVIEQRYVGHGSAASGNRMNARLYSRSLSLALAEAVKGFVIDVRDVVEEIEN